MLAPEPLPSLRELLRQQEGVATRQQLHEAGVSVAGLLANLAAGRWRQLNDHVVCTHNGPLTRRQQLRAVLLSAAGPSALGSLTVLELYDVRGFSTPTVHVIVQRGARVLAVPGVAVKVHESRRFSTQHIWTLDRLRVTTLARATIDAAAWSPDVLTACRLVVAAVQQRRVRPALLSDELAAAGMVRHRRTIRLLLNDLEGGAQALSEVEFLAFCRRHRFPRPKLQSRLDSGGRRRFLDAEFRSRGGRVFRVEIDGGVHLSLTVRWRDTSKDNDAGLDGELVLRYPSVAIYTDDPTAVSQIRRALALS